VIRIEWHYFGMLRYKPLFLLKFPNNKMSYSTTEITSDEIVSDNPMHQRLYFPYEEAAKTVSGNVLELGCGWGRGVEKLIEASENYTGLDKNEELINKLSEKYPTQSFATASFPDLSRFEDNTFDFVVTFQVIEHIQDDKEFLKEAHRVLKKGGKIILTTVNKAFSLSRNPWHIREYHTKELEHLMKNYFNTVDAMGVSGNEKVWEYYEKNKASVNKTMRWDVFNLQHKLPAWILRIPYEFMNRRNREKLMVQSHGTTNDINWDDHIICIDPDSSFDFYFVGTK
jgi:ubiquinone/menaquinone biosynthesis C-methylase UbiE